MKGTSNTRYCQKREADETMEWLEPTKFTSKRYNASRLCTSDPLGMNRNLYPMRPNERTNPVQIFKN